MRPNAGRLDASQSASDASRLQSRRSERAGEWLARGIGGGAYPMPPSSSPSSSFLFSSSTSPPPFRRHARSRLLSWGSFEQRHVIVALAFAATAIAYVERVGFAVVAAALAAERRERIGEQAAAAAAAAATGARATASHHHDEASTGALLSAFYWGYAASQVPGGWAAARFGPSAVLSASFAAWTAATLATPLPGPGCGGGGGGGGGPPSSCSLAPTAAARVLVGLAQGALIPALHTALAQRVPPASRPQSTAAATSGMYLGAALASALLPALAAGAPSGPRAVLRLSAFLGLCWLAAWRCFGAVEGDSVDRVAGGNDLPSGGGKPSAASSAGGRRRLPPTPWGKMLRCRAIWAIVACNFAFHYALYVVMNWMPAYHRDVLGTPLVEMGGGGGDDSSSLAAAAAATTAGGAHPPPPPPPRQLGFSKASAQALPYALMFVAANAGGAAGDAIANGKRGTRRLAEALGAAFPPSKSPSAASSRLSPSPPSDQQRRPQQDRPASRVALARKAVNSLGFLCASAALLAMPHAAAAADPRAFGVAATCLVLAGAGFSRGGFAVNHMDISPRYAGAVMALSNTAGTLAGVVAVSFTGLLLERAGDDAVRGWRGATGVAAGVVAAAGAFFVSCASGEKLFGELDEY
jgi:ACS family sodium-dependent inorganic phosphate cotransporter